jgi:hypothetical protein
MMRLLAVMSLLVLSHEAGAQPALDDFFERTREREDGFGEQNQFVDVGLGIETGNPAPDAMEPHIGSGVRFGLDAGLRHDHDVLRSHLGMELLHLHDTNDLFANFAWRTTAFKAYGRPRDDEGTHLAFDSVVSRRSELAPRDIAQLQRGAYDVVDVEGEVTPLLPRIDKDANLALPIGVATRLRWAERGGFDLKTSASAAIAARALFPGRGHAQLDFFRVKVTQWDAPIGSASSATLSTGYQRLPHGIDTLPIWVLLGYEWAGPYESAVFQIGGAFLLPQIAISPSFDRHFELDPLTATFARVDNASFAVQCRHDVVICGIALESITIQGGGILRAATPELGVRYKELALVARMRAAIAEDVMYPAKRFMVGLDWAP